MTHTRILIPALAALVALASCGKEQAEPAGPASVDTSVGLPMMQRDGWTQARADLGKKLFFDNRLSSNGEMSCSTCHLHEKGWTDGKQFSQKVDGVMNTRNSPSLYNVGYQSQFYWDGRAPSMEKNVAAAWKGHMGGDADAMAEAIGGIETYAAEFQSAFGAAPTGDLMVDALCAFVRSLQAGGTRYDIGQMTGDEKAGKDLFFGKGGCISCHTPPLFTDMLYHNVGIGMKAEKPDPGRHKEDQTAALGSFKTPTLRAVSKTAPYFHDGSVATLEEAVRLMADGGIPNDHIDPILSASFKPGKLSDAEVTLIVAFLKSLAPRETFTPPKLP